MRTLRALLYVGIVLAAAWSLWPRPAPPPTEARFFLENAGTGEATFTLLRSAHRQNEVTVPKAWTGLRLRVLRETLNIGVHTASKSSVAVDDSGLYVGTDDGFFLALDFDGRLRWSLQVPTAARGFHGTAALDEKAAYVGDYAGFLYALDKQSGRLLWQTRPADAIGTSPLIDGEFLYVSSEYGYAGGHLSKLRRTDGQLIWRTPTFNAQTHSSPALLKDKSLLYFGDNRGRLFAINEGTGQLAWSYPAKGAIKNPPVIVKESVLFGSWAKTLERVDAVSGKKIWSTPVSDRIQSTPLWLSSRDEIVVQSQGKKPSLSLIDFATGALRWTMNLKEDPASTISTPLLMTAPSSQTLLLMCEPRAVCLLETASRRLIARREIPGEFSGVPSYHNGRVYMALNRGGLIELSPP